MTSVSEALGFLSLRVTWTCRTGGRPAGPPRRARLRTGPSTGRSRRSCRSWAAAAAGRAGPGHSASWRAGRTAASGPGRRRLLVRAGLLVAAAGACCVVSWAAAMPATPRLSARPREVRASRRLGFMLIRTEFYLLVPDSPGLAPAFGLHNPHSLRFPLLRRMLSGLTAGGFGGNWGGIPVADMAWSGTTFCRACPSCGRTSNVVHNRTLEWGLQGTAMAPANLSPSGARH